MYAFMNMRQMCSKITLLKGEMIYRFVKNAKIWLRGTVNSNRPSETTLNKCIFASQKKNE